MNTDPTQLFRQTWGTYQKVMRDNYMFHHELSKAIRKEITRQGTDLRILDLGCGDAAQVSEILQCSDIAEYSGCDLAPLALDRAKENLAPLQDRSTLTCEDMLKVLEEAPARHYDILFSSLALHHLSIEGKKQFFILGHRAIKTSGCLILMDIMQEEDEVRTNYLDHYIETMKRDWTGLSAKECQSIEEHIRDFDFPEKASTLDTLAREAGFKRAERLEKRTWHQAWCYRP